MNLRNAEAQAQMQKYMNTARFLEQKMLRNKLSCRTVDCISKWMKQTDDGVVVVAVAVEVVVAVVVIVIAIAVVTVIVIFITIMVIVLVIVKQ